MGRSCLCRVRGGWRTRKFERCTGAGSLLCGPISTPGAQGGSVTETWNLTLVPLSQPLTMQMARYKDPLAGSCHVPVSPHPTCQKLGSPNPPGTLPLPDGGSQPPGSASHSWVCSPPCTGMQLGEGGNPAGGHTSVSGGARVSSPGAGEARGPPAPPPQGSEQAGGAWEAPACASPCGRQMALRAQAGLSPASLQLSPGRRSPPGTEGVWGRGGPWATSVLPPSPTRRRQLGDSGSSLPPHSSADLPPAPRLLGATRGGGYCPREEGTHGDVWQPSP